MSLRVASGRASNNANIHSGLVVLLGFVLLVLVLKMLMLILFLFQLPLTFGIIHRCPNVTARMIGHHLRRLAQRTLCCSFHFPRLFGIPALTVWSVLLAVKGYSSLFTSFVGWFCALDTFNLLQGFNLQKALFFETRSHEDSLAMRGRIDSCGRAIPPPHLQDTRHTIRLEQDRVPLSRWGSHSQGSPTPSPPVAYAHMSWCFTAVLGS